MKKAQTIRRIALGVFGAIIIVAVVIFVKHKKSDTYDFGDDYDEDDYYEDDEQGYSEEKLDKSDEEMFKRVNKAKFNIKKEDNTKVEKETVDKNISEDEEDNREIIDRYFRSLDSKRKEKHF